MQKCSVCLSPFRCSNSTNCWCAEFPKILDPVEGQSCMCPKCLRDKIIERKNSLLANGERTFIASLGLPSVPQEGIDFYYENGLFVMSEWYHLRRGNCCGNNCKHCPYK